MSRNASPRTSSRACMRLPALMLACVSVVALAGCGIVPKKQALELHAPVAAVVPDPAWPAVRWQLQVSRPHGSELVDSPRIVVRPSPGELQVYKGAVWAEPAPDLVQDAVLRAFEDSGRIAGVARRGSGISGDYELLLDLRRFDSDYAGGRVPNAEVEIAAKLVSTRANAVVASRIFRHSVPAAGTGVGAVAQAFDTGLSTVLGEIVGWTLVEGERHAAANPPRAR